MKALSDSIKGKKILTTKIIIFYFFQIHGTYRQKNRIYKEDTFYGKGKLITEASEKELEEDLAERRSENPLAYRSNKLEFELEEKDLRKNKKKRSS